MSKGKQATFDLVLGASDKWSKPWAKFEKGLDLGGKKLKALQMGAINLGRETGLSRFIDSGKNLGSAFSKAAAPLAGLGAKVGIGLGIAGVGFAALLLKVTSVGDEAVIMSKKTGLGVEAWQKWSYAAVEAGTNSEALRNSFLKLNQITRKAVEGNKESLKIFKDVGIQIMDNNDKVKTSEQLYGEVADKVKALADAGQMRKAENLAFDFFGEGEAKEIMPLLKLGNDGIKSMHREAESLGIIMSESGAKSAEDFAGKLDKAKNTVWGFAMSLGEELLPTLNKLADGFFDSTEGMRGFVNKEIQEFVKDLNEALPEIKKGVVEAGKAVFEFGEKFKRLGEFLGWGNTLKLGLGLLAAVIAGPLIGAVVSLGIALMTTPIGWVVAGLALLTTIGIALYKNWDSIAGWFIGIFADIKDAFTRSWTEGIVHVLQNFTPLGWVTKGMGALFSYFTGLSFSEAGSQLINSFWDGLKGKWVELKGWFSKQIAELLDGVPDWIKSGANFVAGGDMFGPPIGAAEMAQNSTSTTTNTERQEMELKLTLPPGMQAQVAGSSPDNLDIQTNSDQGFQLWGRGNF